MLILLLHEILKGFQHLKIGKRVTVICTSDAGFIALKVPENVWRPGSARTRWGSLSAPPDPLAAKGGRVIGGEGKGKAGVGKGKGGGGEGKGGGTGRGGPPHIFCCNSTTVAQSIIHPAKYFVIYGVK